EDEAAEEGAQRERHRSHRRLASLGAGELPLRLQRLRVRMEERPQRAADAFVHLRPERLVEAIERFAEGGDLLVGLAEQADPLRALTREEQRDLRFRERSLPAETARGKLD